MSDDADFDRLGQCKMLAWLTADVPISEMVTVYLSKRGGQQDHGIYCTLIPNAKIEETLEDPTWELRHGEGMPGAVVSTSHGKDTAEYYRFGDGSGIEPLVIDREFHGIRENYTEINEEFRLFHRLYHDRKLDRFIKVDNDGHEILVASIEPGLVKIRLKEIRQFLAIKEMHLAIQFDCREYSAKSL